MCTGMKFAHSAFQQQIFVIYMSKTIKYMDNLV